MVTLPARTNENNNNHDKAGVVAAVDDEGYVVLNVYSDTSIDTIRSYFINNRYIKYVFQGDWTAEKGYITGYDVDDKFNAVPVSVGNVIWDLNGYTVNFYNRRGEFAARYLEIRDSSVSGTGQINGNIYFSGFAVTNTTLVIRGGTIDGNIAMDNSGHDEHAYLYGGKVNGQLSFNYFNGNDKMDTYFELYGGTITGGVRTTDRPAGKQLNIKTDTQPYTQVTYDVSGNIAAITTPDYFAVSTTPYATGIYNYAYGYQWEISCAELRNLTIPTDQTYYLWGRLADGAYQYLYAL